MNTSSSTMLRSWTVSDSADCLTLFRDCIRRVCADDYTPEQINAWASPQIVFDDWAQRFQNRSAYVACQRDAIVGFIDMDDFGYLDRLFVSADHQRQGIARRLVDQVVADAKRLGCQRIKTEASLTARPFFQSMGFAVVKQQVVECSQVQMINFQMQLSLS
ncbi:GNAT family N-acetyltransferase [Stieleria marina]|uniref:Putative N-acetyltransferase YafP n=1 Tax=Stieleria marina TaxID=1930275 RepID=A0A517NVU9_9BACT|nr:putative N-acetyltransferase YafP [Planctomycetes bacterium K23_9]